MSGAFVNIVTWPTDVEEYRRNADRVISKIDDLSVADVVGPEPVAARRARVGGALKEETEDMIERATSNPNAIIYGTFFQFRHDDA